MAEYGSSDTNKAALSDADILTQARKEFTIADKGEKTIRDEYDRCTRFVALDQYPTAGAASIASRTAAGLPSLIIDNLGPVCDQIINDWIRNRMGLEVDPSDALASEPTAKVLSGYVRNLWYLSRGQYHVDSAFRQMVRGNRGFIGLLTRRVPGSMRQELIIRGFPDAQAVYLDPFFKEIDLTDLDYAFVRSLMSQERFRREYPDAEVTDFDAWGPEFSDWVKAEGIILSEYWKCRYEPRKLQKLTKKIPVRRGTQRVITDEVYDDEYEKLPRGVAVAKNPSDGGAPWEEDEPKRIVEQMLMTGREILYKTQWIGSVIPIVPLWAKEMIVEGERRLFSAVSRALDAQCQLNYAESGIAEELGTTVRAPWVGALGQFKSQRKAWQTANLERFAFLEYDPVVVGDKLAPPPTRDQHEPQIQALAMASDRAQNNIRMTTGINKSNLGIAEGSKISARATNTLKAEGDNATADFPAAGAVALETLGTIIVEVAHKILTEPEIIQIMNQEEKQESVLINADPRMVQGAPAAQIDAHFLDKGKYKVRVAAAPSHQTMREETQDALQTLFQELPDPQKVLIAAPLVRTMNFNGKDGIAERLELPQFKQQTDGPPVPPEAQAVIQQGQQMIQAAQAHIAALEQERNAKILDLQNKKEIEAAHDETQLAVARIQQETKTGTAAFETEIEQIKAQLEILSGHFQAQADAAAQVADQNHERAMQIADQQHQAQMADQAHQQAMDQQAAQPEPAQQ